MEEKMTEGVGYVHLRTKKHGCVTVAFEKTDDLGPVERKYGLAFCSPGEPFSKKIGRDIAEGRMQFKGMADRHVMSIDGIAAIMDGVYSLMQEIYDEYEDYVVCEDEPKYPEPYVPRWFMIFWDHYKKELELADGVQETIVAD